MVETPRWGVSVMHMVGQTFLSVLRRRDTVSGVGALLAAP